MLLVNSIVVHINVRSKIMNDGTDNGRMNLFSNYHVA